MQKRVILITGTPCVGKTSVSRMLTSKLDAEYVNLTDLAIHEHLTAGKDKERGSIIVDENKIRRRLFDLIKSGKKRNVIIDGHYAVSVVPEDLVSHVFVLRRDPVELRKSMLSSAFTGRKLWENLASEILDVCLVDALNVHGGGKVCELDVSGRNVEEIVKEILEVLEGRKKCCVGVVDWLGKLESQGVLDDYLKI